MSRPRGSSCPPTFSRFAEPTASIRANGMSASPVLPMKDSDDSCLPDIQIANHFGDELFMDDSIYVGDSDNATIPYYRSNSPREFLRSPSSVSKKTAFKWDRTQRYGSEGYAELLESVAKENDKSRKRSLEKPGELGLASNLSAGQKLNGQTGLVSIIHESDSSMQSKPEQWVLVEDQRAVDLEDRLGNWPARLLHIPSMTSLAWHTGNYYGHHKEPRYSTLSYTWGRWRLLPSYDPPEKPLQVSGIPWKVPAVNPRLFTIAQFERVLAQVSAEGDTEFVWVDVACIDQREGSEEGAREIGRQAKIFANAQETFIWLVPDPEKSVAPPLISLLQILADTTDVVGPLYESIISGPSRPKNPDDTIASWAGATGLQESLHSNRRWIMDAAWSISHLVDLPWFSSLWTLQEAFLQPLAKFLNQDGMCMVYADGEAVVLDDVLWVCKMLYDLCTFQDKFDPGENSSAGTGLAKSGLLFVIERGGLEALAERDRMSLFTCTKTRKSIKPLDRIYGIMQIWGFRLGNTAPGADFTHEWTLQELELQLGIHLVDHFPIESQLHVHTRDSSSRQSWRISDHSVVPPHCLAISSSGQLEGIIDRHLSQLSYRRANDVTYGYFEAKVRPFDSLQEAWKFIGDHKAFEQRWSELHQNGPVRIALDSTILLNRYTLQVPYSLRNVPESKHLALAGLITSATRGVGRKIMVMLLGTVTQVESMNRTTAIGIMLLKAPDPVIGRWWKRLGICLWTVFDTSPDLPAELQTAIDTLSPGSTGWSMEEGLFG